MSFQDEPPLVKKGAELDWEGELHKLVKLERILSYETVAQKASLLPLDLSLLSSMREGKADAAIDSVPEIC
jgi:hypothetical protein